MRTSVSSWGFFLLALSPQLGSAQACATPVDTNVAAPSMAPGFNAGLVADGFTKPRGLVFDSQGRLLVVDAGVGVYAITLTKQKNVCVTQQSRQQIITDSTLNHGIQISPDGNTLYVSSSDKVFQYDYDPTSGMTVGTPTVIIQNMTNTDHATRTMELSKKKPGTMIVNRGSDANIDPAARKLSSGHARIKTFDLTARGADPYDYTADGYLLGWGLRNNVGIAEEPVTGNIYSVENSLDNMVRCGKDIHDNNPGESLKFFGTLINNTSPNQGSNFGYPDCFPAWGVPEIPQNNGIKVGTLFSRTECATGGVTDEFCQTKRTAPRLTFQAHMAPLDIKFVGNSAFITFHGSHDRPTPVGYKISSIAFKNGDPVAGQHAQGITKTILANADVNSCYTAGNCIRPVSMSFDKLVRMFFSDDQNGQIYVVTYTGGTGKFGKF